MEVEIVNYSLIELIPTSDAERALLSLWAKETSSLITDRGTMRIKFEVSCPKDKQKESSNNE